MPALLAQEVMNSNLNVEANEDDGFIDYRAFVNFIHARPIRGAHGNVVIDSQNESDKEDIDR